MSFLKDTPGFTSSPQSTGTDQNTLSSNASLRSYQGDLKMFTRSFPRYNIILFLPDVFLSGDKLPTTSKPIDSESMIIIMNSSYQHCFSLDAILARTITGEQHSPFLFPMEFNQLDGRYLLFRRRVELLQSFTFAYSLSKSIAPSAVSARNSR